MTSTCSAGSTLSRSLSSDLLGHLSARAIIASWSDLPPTTLVWGYPSTGRVALARWAATQHGAIGPDVLVTPFTVPGVREALAHFTRRPTGQRKVWITELGARVPDRAANAALKVCEEPPPGCHVLLVGDRTAPLAAVPATLRSRAWLVPTGTLPRYELAEVLVTQCGWTRARATLAAGAGTVDLAVQAEESTARWSSVAAYLRAAEEGDEELGEATASVFTAEHLATVRSFISHARRTGRSPCPPVGVHLAGRQSVLDFMEVRLGSGARPTIAAAAALGVARRLGRGQ